MQEIIPNAIAIMNNKTTIPITMALLFDPLLDPLFRSSLLSSGDGGL